MIHTETVDYDSDICWQIGKRMQEIRLQKGLSGVEVAAFLDINKNQFSRIENGKANCTMPQLYVLTQLYECTSDYLLFGKEQEPKLTQAQQDAITAIKNVF